MSKICPPNCISQKDLLYVGWKYEDFVGLRLLHDYYAESAFISLLLTKLTALTYFVMVGILLMRKIILWFFIIISPIFPLLLLYYPVRNTGKIWIGEFFRWLLYAPLFAIFLNGLVFMWRQQIPLLFVPPQGAGAVGTKSQIIYPTAVNILLGGPKQFVTPDNSVNLTETFALYVVALLMLWVVILLPWILLQIFLDYASNFSPGESAVMKTLVNLAGNKKGAPPGGGGGTSPAPVGSAISLPFTKKFNMPAGIGPTGAAKEMTSETSSTSTNFATSTFLPTAQTAQMNAQVLSVANVQLPTMRDIARYDTALVSNDTSRLSEVKLASETLEKIANPVAVTNTADREKYTDIREKLTQEAQQGNILATSILNAANASSNTSTQSSSNVVSSISSSQMQSILQQIANPASTSSSSSSQNSSVVNREKMTQLHDMLSKESKENNNKLAESLLSVNEKSSSSEIEKIKESLMQAAAQGDRMASSVMSSISSVSKQQASTQQVKTVLQQVNNPQAVSNPVNREKLTKLQEQLSKASKEGNDLASAVLKVNDKTSAADIQKIQEKINLAKQKGEPIATDLATLTQAQTAAPAVNRVQKVSKEDYEAVRDMWKENYSNLEVPQGMAGNRTEWIKDDINKIDKIIGKLSSTDKEKVQEGMDEVGGLMPFLLMGGFSQTEIVAYLKAKQDAAKDVVTSLSAEEETKVSVSTGAAHAEKAMSATIESSSVSTGRGSDEEAAVSPLANISGSVTNNVSSEVSNEILAMVDLKLPKMRDVVRYETRSMTKDTTKVADVQKMHNMLEKISNPASVPEGPDRVRIEQLREKLLDASAQGNVTANVILSAAATASKAPVATPVTVKAVLQQIAAPQTAASEVAKKRFTEMHDKLSEASKNGDALAASILSVTDKTPVEDIEKLRGQLEEAKQKGEPLATSILSNVSGHVSLPSANRLQQVSQEELDEVKNLWKENYQNLEVPQGMAGTRTDWIKDDIKKIDETIGLLTSEDKEKVKEGLDQVSNVLPFLLMGGYSQTEIVSYLKAKQDAAKEVITTLTTEEESKVSVSTQAASAQQTMSASLDTSSDEGDVSPLSVSTTNMITPQVSNEILAMVELKMPKIKDIARYDAGRFTHGGEHADEVKKMHQVLTNLSNPAFAAEGAEREKFEQLREKLIEESGKGNMTANVILSAADTAAVVTNPAQAQGAMKRTLRQLADPSLVTSPIDKARVNKLHDALAKAKEEGNPLATSLLAIQEATSAEDIEKISRQLQEANKQGDPLAKDVLTHAAAPTSVPAANQLQKVNPEEFEEVKKLWSENYKTLPLAPEFGTDVKGRLEWIRRDMTEIQALIDLLSSDDPEKQKEGISKVHELLPFMLLGGFSLPEMVSYLRAKYDAAKEVIAQLEEEENQQVSVPASATGEEPKEAAAQQDEKKDA